MHATSWEIGLLDRKCVGFDKTMRELLVDIQSDAYNDYVFLGINEDGTGGHAFTFPISYEEKARDFITEFPAYLKHHHGDKIKKYLTSSAVERLDDSKWDPELERVISEEDIELDYIEKEAINRTWMKNATEDQLVDETIETNNDNEVNQDKSKTAPLFNFGNNVPRDDTPVSTFGTHRQGDTNESQNENDNASQKSASTISTMGSKNTIATRMTSVEDNMQKMGETLNSILSSLRTLHGSPNHPPGPGESQGKESSANAVSPTSDMADAS